jgi:hypothetical protein
VDPADNVAIELPQNVKVVQSTSDDFFASPDPTSWFAEDTVDLTFIDGMHLFEFALRDFMNSERLSGPASVIVLDDMLPRSGEEAARDRTTRVWAGDVYKVAAVLERYRPDLTIAPIDTDPTGLLLVLGLDPTNTALDEHYEEIVAGFATDDPQLVPDDIIHRSTAADPGRVARSRVWRQLAAARDTSGPVPSIETLRSMRGTARFKPVPRESASGN